MSTADQVLSAAATPSDADDDAGWLGGRSIFFRYFFMLKINVFCPVFLIFGFSLILCCSLWPHSYEWILQNAWRPSFLFHLTTAPSRIFLNLIIPELKVPMQKISLIFGFSPFCVAYCDRIVMRSDSKMHGGLPFCFSEPLQKSESFYPQPFPSWRSQCKKITSFLDFPAFWVAYCDRIVMRSDSKMHGGLPFCFILPLQQAESF